MMRRKTGNRETGKSISKTTLENKTPYESRWTSGGHAEDGRAAAIFKHLARRQWRITLADHPVMMRCIGRRIVQQIAADFADARAWVHAD